MKTKELSFQKDVYSNFFSVAPGVWGMKDKFVNMYMILNTFDGNWVLLDTGLKSSAKKILKMAEQLFGKESRPSAIILTHGHFDHVGSLITLAEDWNVPVYAHYMEIPYLTGKSPYPPADPTVGGGLLSAISFMYPNKPINLWNRISVLPDGGGVPGLPEWKYIHTPGHSPGHVSFFREYDGVLIAGDAFTTTHQESAFSVMFQKKQLSGPPKYFTYDWSLARRSVRELKKLEPQVAATGHGKPMSGKELRRELHNLSNHFYEVAVPSHGRYVNEPAVTDANGIVYVPEKLFNPRKLALQVLGATAALAITYLLVRKKLKENRKRRELLAYEIW